MESHSSSPDPYYDSCDEDLTRLDVSSFYLEINDDYEADWRFDTDLGTLIWGNRLDAVADLMKKGIIKTDHLNHFDRKGRNALHIACKLGFFEMSILLIQAGSDVNFRSSDWETPLHFACQSHNIPLVKLLVEYGASINPESWSYTPLQIACMNYNISMAKCLLELGCNINCTTYRENNALHIAVEAYNEIVPINIFLEVVEFLIVSGCNINAENSNKRTPLSYACERGITPLVLLLLKHGANPLCVTRDKSLPLKIALDKCDFEIIELLLKNGADANLHSHDPRDPPPIHAAIHKPLEKAIKLIDILMKYKGNIKIYHNGMTVLHVACIRKSLDLIKYLLNYIDINIQNLCGQTPLHIACLYGHLDVVQLLLDSGCDVNCYYDQNTSPLHVTIISKHKDIVKLLLQAGANLHDGKSILKTTLRLDKLEKPSAVPYKVDLDMLYFLLKVDYNIQGDSICPIEKFMENIDPIVLSANSELFQILMERSHQTLTLQQMCCQKIRKCLGHKLKNKIHKLKLPSYLKSLVAYEFL